MIVSARKYLTAFAAAAVLTLGLYGCGGGGGSGPTTGGDTMMPDDGDDMTGGDMMPGEEMEELEFGDGMSLSTAAAVYADSPSDSLATLLPDGNTAFAPVSAAVLRDFGSSLTALPDEDAAFVKAISSDGANGFHVTFVIDGSESMVHFTANDYSDQLFSYAASVPSGNNYLLWSMTDSIYRDPNDRTSGASYYDYFDSIGWHANTPGDNFEGYSTFGARTDTDNMPAGSATYYGSMSARVWAGNDPNYPSGRAALSGILELNANFDSSEISGQVDELYAQLGEFTNPFNPLRDGNSIDISNGVIVHGQFGADWVGVDTNAFSRTEVTVSGLAGTMVGEFYGPNAEEVGGVIGGSGSAIPSVPDYNLVGVFGAVREDVARPTGQ